MSLISKRKRSRPPVFCKHCNSYVSHPTFYRHKVKFYDATEDTWTVSAAAQVVSDSDSEVEISIDSESVAATNEAQTEQQLFTDPKLESMFSKLAIT